MAHRLAPTNGAADSRSSSSRTSGMNRRLSRASSNILDDQNAQIREKIAHLEHEKKHLSASILDLDRQTEKLKRTLQLKEDEDVKDEGTEEEAVYPIIGFKFKKAGTITNSRIDSIVEKCTRKNLRGWIKKGLVGMSGEVWGVADREDREAAFNSMLKYLTNQEGCTVQHLGRKPEGDVQLEPLFFVKSGKKPS
eukprot:m.38172 g.38172  ORF g.38172 m.38172 type:complete len:194 (-) comp7780_c0_seq2:126-707(-)